MRRPFIDREMPDVYTAMTKASAASRKSSHEAGLGDDLIELINVRVSQINRCLTCLSLHVPRARQAGITQRQLDLLPAWREAGEKTFTPQQLAALDLAEALTRLEEGTDLDALAEAALEHLSRAQIAAVQWTTTLINAFNRISIASGHPALTVKE